MSRSPRVEVVFEPGGTRTAADPGSTLMSIAEAAGVPLPNECAGRGTCGACGVRVLEGALAEPDEVEAAALARCPRGVRLACRARVAGPVTVRVIGA